MRSYHDTVDYVTGEDNVPEKPMTCSDCGAPVFWEEDGDYIGFYHALDNPELRYGRCFGYISWIMGDIADYRHPLFAEAMSKPRVELPRP